MPKNPNEPLPLYGAMKIQTPRSEHKTTQVFAIIANPQVLQQKGKKAENLKVNFIKKKKHNFKFFI